MENASFYETLEESEKKFRLLYERAVEGIFQGTLDGQFLSVNPSLVEMLGYDSVDDLFARISDFTQQLFVNIADRGKLKDILKESGQVQGFETEMFKKDGSRIWISLSARLTQGSMDGDDIFEGLVLDVTSRKQKEVAERRQKVAEAATRSKSEFLANMSHEIRTPMNTILGMAELLSETKLSIEQKDYVRTFKYSGEQLLTIINDILDFSKIEAGQIELESIPFDLIEQIEIIGKIMILSAYDKGIELVCRVAPDVHRFRLGDPTRLRQIITNLIGNAIKFTKKGEVVLNIVSDSDSSDPELLTFCVRDTGIGVPVERQETIFNSFSQADTSTTRKYSGTGLGLTICKRLVELMGGKIWIESESGKGSQFFFKIKYPLTTPMSTVTTATAEELKGMNILVVEDNVTSRLTIKEYLLGWGGQVTDVQDGEKALQALNLADQQKLPYQLMILDFNLPDMDALQLATRVNTMKLTDSPLCIVLTSSEGIGNKILRGSLNPAGYIVKPVKRDDLLNTIQTAFGNRSNAADIEEQQVTVELPAIRLLLVEDIEANWKIIKLFLKDTPVFVNIAENGKIALERYQTEHYDVVLMDIQMPEMDGYEATRRIRSWEKENKKPQTPIIALTAHAFIKYQEECYQAGCTDFLSKPIKKSVLIEKL